MGTLEIVPAEAPLTLFVWSKNRMLPVRITEFSITEEAFDPALNPIRAKVSLGLRVLSVNDLGFDAQRQQPVHGLSAAERSSSPRRARRRRSRRSASTRFREDRHMFPPTSRYYASPANGRTRRAGRHATIVYVRRRFVPPPERFALLQEHIVTEGERLDTIAAEYLGDPEQFWRVVRRQRRDAARTS